jgi:uncharacterized Zn-finger protein
VKEIKKSLQDTHPKIAKEAFGWNPSEFTYGSDKKLQWKCLKNHTWHSTIKDRTSKKTGCPYCGNRKLLQGFNDLATTNPELAQEAFGWDPKKVFAGTNKKLQWKCKEGHVWTATGTDRNQYKTGCPYCGRRKLLQGFNDLESVYPELAQEAFGWDPKKVIAGTNKKLQWKCREGHVWLTSGNHRSSNESGCPVCSNNTVLEGFNDLSTTHPELAQEAFGWDPKKVFAGTSKKLQWKCKEGHVWIATGNNRSTSKTSCPSCAQQGFDPNKDAFFYFLIQPIWELFQIGITNYPQDRLKKHSLSGWQVLDIRGPMDGQNARELETALLTFLRKHKADLSPEHVAGKFDGYTESWTIDSYKVNNLKELIDKASEAGY